MRRRPGGLRAWQVRVPHGEPGWGSGLIPRLGMPVSVVLAVVCRIKQVLCQKKKSLLQREVCPMSVTEETRPGFFLSSTRGGPRAGAGQAPG